jgi:cytochrome P450
MTAGVSAVADHDTALPFDPADPAIIRDPYPSYARLRATDPVPYLARHKLWMVTRHEDVTRVLREPALFSSKIGMSSNPAGAGLPRTGINYRFGTPDVRVLIATDPPDHQVFRHAVASVFTPSSVKASAERVAGLARTCVRDLLEHNVSGTADFYAHVAEPLPALVLADLFGIPDDMRDEFRAWATIMTSDLDETERGASGGLRGVVPPGQHRPVGRGMDMFRYFSKNLRHPPDIGRATLFNAINNARDAGVSDRELLAFCAFLLVAGLETTTSLLTNLLAALVQHPQALRQLRESPDLVNAAVEEGLRYDTPVQFLWRGTTERVELGGREIPAGARLMVGFGSANRDERAFADPDVFRLDRGQTPHLGFGGGPHYCLGAHLARLETRCAIRELLAATQEIEIAGEPERTRNIVLRGHTSQPVRLRAR